MHRRKSILWGSSSPLSPVSRRGLDRIFLVFNPCRLDFRLKLNSTWLIMSRLDTTRHIRRVELVHLWLCRACWTARLDTLVSTRSTRRTCHVETWRAKWNFGFCQLSCSHGSLLLKTPRFFRSCGRKHDLCTYCTYPLRLSGTEWLW